MKNAAAVNERLAKLDEAGWEKKGRFLMGGKVPSIYGPSADASGT